jgi:pimeloyl-ACP methyl ester carboxylesterase
MTKFGPDNPTDTYIEHDFTEIQVDLGEVIMNYATAGKSDKPALLLIPSQTESWWGYEKAMHLLADNFQVFAVDLRGQGRSTRTPGRYSLNTMGNDLVRFISLVIKRPTLVSGLSSGGVLSAWLSAYAMPDTILGAVFEDPPLFAAELSPAIGQSIRQGAGPMFGMLHKYLGNQWSVGNWQGLRAAADLELPPTFAAMFTREGAAEVPQSIREYDPEWGFAFVSGNVGVNCDHASMLRQVKTPVLFTHHARQINEANGALIGAISDEQVRYVEELVSSSGQSFTYLSFPEMPHSMHAADPELFVNTIREWITQNHQKSYQ